MESAKINLLQRSVDLMPSQGIICRFAQEFILIRTIVLARRGAVV